MSASQIDSLNTVFDQECKSPERKLECERFRLFIQQANAVDTLNFNEVDTAFKSSPKFETMEQPVEVAITKEQACMMRESPISFNFFLLIMAQAHYSVQIPILEDMTNFAKQSIRNRRLMVQSMPQSFLLQMLHTSQHDINVRSPHKFEYSYVHYLVNFIQCLFSYGVLLNESNDKPGAFVQHVLACLSTNRRLNYMFVESLINILSSPRS
jgi:hypothetical protein